ncbi:hypothetical protein STEG23_011819, partial [Scotinomys teguina]
QACPCPLFNKTPVSGFCRVCYKNTSSGRFFFSQMKCTDKDQGLHISLCRENLEAQNEFQDKHQTTQRNPVSKKQKKEKEEEEEEEEKKKKKKKRRRKRKRMMPITNMSLYSSLS